MKYTKHNSPKSIHGVKVRFMHYVTPTSIMAGITKQSNRTFQVGHTVPLQGIDCPVIKVYNSGMQGVIDVYKLSGLSTATEYQS